jgi:hypothetical protein
MEGVAVGGSGLIRGREATLLIRTLFHCRRNTVALFYKRKTTMIFYIICKLIMTLLVNDVLCHFFSSPCQRQCELLPSLDVRRPLSVVCRSLTFHI